MSLPFSFFVVKSEAVYSLLLEAKFIAQDITLNPDAFADVTALSPEVHIAVEPALRSAPVETVSTNENDFALAQKAANGSIAAFEIIYERYNRRTYSLCLRMTKNQTEAEDLTQDVFIQLFRKIGSFQGKSAFSTWLHRLTVNQVLMHFRRRSVKNEKTAEDEIPEQTVVGTENPLKMPVVDRIALKNAVEQLPNGYRRVFLLHDVEGYEHEEIARLMGISVGTSKSQLHKARLKLRGLLLKVSE